MKILVVGGAGYVGSFCVRRLVRAGHAITVYDNLSAGHRRAVDPQAAFIQGDLADRAKLDAVFAAGGFEAVLHFAALLNVGESVREPLAYYRNNVANTLHLLECLRTHSVRRLVFSSTCAVYGEPGRLPITEDLPKSPISPYGHTKLAVEWMLADCATAWGLGAVALRYFNAAGAALDGRHGEDHHPEIHLIPLVLQVALGQRTHIEVYGTDYPTPDGTCIRDYVHVEDLAEAHLRAVEACAGGVFQAYNVGTGTGTSVREIIEAARTVTAHEIKCVERPRRPGDPPALFADPSRLRAGLEWEAAHSDPEAVVASAWKWHRENPDGYA